MADGRHVLTASKNEIKQWDIQTGAELRTLGNYDGDVYPATLLPDGRHYFQGSSDKPLKLWDLKTGKVARTLNPYSNGKSLVVLTDGKRLLSVRSTSLQLIELETGKVIRSYSWNMDWIKAMAVLANGKHILAATSANSLMLTDIESGSAIRLDQGFGQTRITKQINALALLIDGKGAIAASDDHTLRLYNENYVVMRTFSGHTAGVTSVAALTDGKRVLSASNDFTLKLWDIKTASTLRTFTGHTREVTAVALLPAGQHCLSASLDTNLKLWNLENGSELRTYSGHSAAVSAVAVQTDGKRFLSASYDRTLKLWDIETSREICTFAGHKDSVTDVAILADGKRAISSSKDNTLILWNLESGNPIRSFSGHTAAVSSVVLHPDGHRVFSASLDNTIKLWDLETGKATHSIPRPFDFAGSPGSYIGEDIAVALLADGRRAISASADCTFKLWDLETGLTERSFTGHMNPVKAMAVLEDDKRAVSVSTDGLLKLWDLETGNCLLTYMTDGPLNGCATTGNMHFVTFGFGGMHFVHLEGYQPAVTPDCNEPDQRQTGQNATSTRHSFFEQLTRLIKPKNS
jgi:WD40 repeat protein